MYQSSPWLLSMHILCTVDQSTYATALHSLHRRPRDDVEILTDARYCKAIFTNVGLEFGYAPPAPDTHAS